MKNGFVCLTCLITLAMSSQGKVTYTYAIKESDTLKMDVYTPYNISSTDSLPVFMWMHGGGFEGGNRDDDREKKLCEDVATRGYIGVSISYRLLRKGTTTGFGCNCDNDDKLHTFREATTDFMDAANYLVHNSKSLQIDTSKIIAGGSSAGAEGILNAAFMREYFIDDLSKYNAVKFAGVLALAGAVVNANYITKANALPSVLFHGTADELVPFATAPHRHCVASSAGYIILDGSAVIAEKLDELESSYYFQKVNGGMHEQSAIPFDELDDIFNFFEKTVFENKIIQTKIIKQKQL